VQREPLSPSCCFVRMRLCAHNALFTPLEPMSAAAAGPLSRNRERLLESAQTGCLLEGAQLSIRFCRVFLESLSPENVTVGFFLVSKATFRGPSFLALVLFCLAALGCYQKPPPTVISACYRSTMIVSLITLQGCQQLKTLLHQEGHSTPSSPSTSRRRLQLTQSPGKLFQVPLPQLIWKKTLADMLVPPRVPRPLFLELEWSFPVANWSMVRTKDVVISSLTTS